MVGSLISPDWYALDASRGHESYNNRVFMRATVAVSDYLLYIPAIVIFTKWYSRATGTERYDRSIALAILLSMPSLIIIDYGHFQYNSVMLGLAVLAFASFLADRLLWGSLLFVLSLCFKQIALYYAPAVFAYLLGLCVSFGKKVDVGGSGLSITIPAPMAVRIDVQTLVLLGVTVLSTFAVMVAPFAVLHGEEHGALEQLAQMVHRVFPFARGLWEDKVANFWCATNIAFKYRELLSRGALQKVSLALTLLAVLPPCGLLFLRPKKTLLPWGVAGCAWGFFLFSFQVHEKSVLLPMVAMTLVVAGGVDRDLLSWIGWANNVAMFSMWPLLRREGLGLQYTVLTALWSWLLSLHELPSSILAKALHAGFYVGALGLHVAEITITGGIVDRLPDIWVVGNVLLCFVAFAWLYVWVLYRMADEAGLVDDIYAVMSGAKEEGEKERLKKPVAVQITPCRLVHRIRIPQIRGRKVVVEGGNGVFLRTPAVPEAVPQLEYREHQLAFRRAAFLHTRAESLLLDRGGIGSSGLQVGNRGGGIRLAAPAVAQGEAVEDLAERVVGAGGVGEILEQLGRVFKMEWVGRGFGIRTTSLVQPYRLLDVLIRPLIAHVAWTPVPRLRQLPDARRSRHRHGTRHPASEAELTRPPLPFVFLVLAVLRRADEIGGQVFRADVRVVRSGGAAEEGDAFTVLILLGGLAATVTADVGGVAGFLGGVVMIGVVGGGCRGVDFLLGGRCGAEHAKFRIAGGVGRRGDVGVFMVAVAILFVEAERHGGGGIC
ncbi:LOW QUALITY PROTEIN: hypothetical protein Dda_7461 [Drechslerella dactyloides]|uniref:Alpha-1,3-glucosyltransferase n=1 Tax=Drechslerella dactyloides TaxID=74499 RepID=A0AAD6IS68_DREDA|nr:LOW QUALITY PROTEIN: hypothetical protein Dda_7461 [Drechslerella dactyloides]